MDPFSVLVIVPMARFMRRDPKMVSLLASYNHASIEGT